MLDRLWISLGLLLLVGACRTQYDAPKREATGSRNNKIPDELQGTPIAAPPREENTEEDDGGEREIPDEDRRAPSPDLPSQTSYLPLCSEGGIRKDGDYSLSFRKVDSRMGRMELTEGSGFSCKLDPQTDFDDSLPTCSEACPGDAASVSNGWGWCSASKGFSCRISQAGRDAPRDDRRSTGS